MSEGFFSVFQGELLMFCRRVKDGCFFFLSFFFFFFFVLSEKRFCGEGGGGVFT